MRVTIYVLFCLLLGTNSAANAHLEGVTDTHILIGEAAVNIVYTVPHEFLESASQETGLSFDQIAEKAFAVNNNGVACQFEVSDQQELESIESLQFDIDHNCQQSLGVLFLDYRFLLAQFPEHENFTRMSIAGSDQNVVLNLDLASLRINVAEIIENMGISLQGFESNGPVGQASVMESLKQSSYFFSTGAKHILYGFDHLMFLLALLLLPMKFKELIALVTTFTIAHSITLTLSVLDVISLPVLLVEAIIAFSIVYIAFENLWVLRRQRLNSNSSRHLPLKRRLVITFGFGLLHGIGFSYLLKEIGYGDQILLPLLMFNVGVEAGQLLAIICFLPILYLIFMLTKKISCLPAVCSALVGLVGIVWFLQRI